VLLIATGIFDAYTREHSENTRELLIATGIFYDFFVSYEKYRVHLKTPGSIQKTPGKLFPTTSSLPCCFNCPSVSQSVLGLFTGRFSSALGFFIQNHLNNVCPFPRKFVDRSTPEDRGGQMCFPHNSNYRNNHFKVSALTTKIDGSVKPRSYLFYFFG
jgi:hypothetical protein